MFDWDKMRPAKSAEQLRQEAERKGKRKVIILGVELKKKD